MNLISDPWIPIRRRDGRTETIRPWELTEDHADNPVVGIDLPRPDLASGLVTFLIGLFQAAFAPADRRTWERLYRDPPSAADLRAALEPMREHFQVDGEGPRCFQDLELRDEEPRLIGALLIDEPGGQTLRRNIDLFIKRGQFPSLGLTAAVAALITMQASAPAGGKGHRTSLRGGGPLNTLVVPDPVNDEFHFSLWRLIWLNVLDRNRAAQLSGNPDLDSPESMFPWLAPTRTSEPKTGRYTYPEDAHPLQMYFAMPRRIRLNLNDLAIGQCPLTGREEPLVKSYQTRSYGVNYQGAWQHPLSPCRIDKDGLPIALHPRPGGIGYRHWLHLTFGTGNTNEKNAVLAAPVVNDSHDLRKNRCKTLVWAFGYDMDNMKARGWYESTMPIYHLDGERNENLRERAGYLIQAATEIASNLRQAVKHTWFSDKAPVSGDLGFVTQNFWHDTERDFFTALKREFEALRDDAADPDRQPWLHVLQEKSLRLFDLYAASGNIAYEDPKRIARARYDLQRFNSKKSILTALGISARAA